MYRAFLFIKARWWPAAMAACLASVVFARVGFSAHETKVSWIRVQAEERWIASLDPQIRYLCAGDMAVDLLHGPAPFTLGEDRLVLRDQAIKERCLPPLIPPMAPAAVLVSATSPEAGYGVTLFGMAGSPGDALQSATANLTHAGWHETAASLIAGEKRPGLKIRTFERDRAWLFLVVERDAASAESLVLLAGRFHPALMGN
ncbi:MAG: hypothetical protein QNJ97_09600 [Myxococcota bacterium]|nr:hypothetical protein [Myxococcota bacterium]